MPTLYARSVKEAELILQGEAMRKRLRNLENQLSRLSGMVECLSDSKLSDEDEMEAGQTIMTELENLVKKYGMWEDGE